MIGNNIKKLHNAMKERTVQEDLDQRGCTHCAASYTTSLMHNI